MALLTVLEVANALRVSTKTVYRLLDAGTLRASKVGGQYRISQTAVDELLAPTSPAA